MSDHLIGLRRAWIGEADGEARRIDLPTTWDAADLPARLTRSFRTPRIESGNESILLRFEAVPGVVRILLNGVAIGPGPAPGDSAEVEIGHLLSGKNALELHLKADAVPRGMEWGRVALVIRAR